MSPNQIDFSDYHRTVIGYHGTSVEAANRLVDGEEFSPTDEDDEWFGKGVYFWEHAYQQAWKWAKEHHGNPAVVGSVIRLGNCFDLLDPGNAVKLKEFYNDMITGMHAAQLAIPRNHNSQKYLDCAVFNHMYDFFERDNVPLDTARAVYVPSDKRKRVYERSWISEETHIQICVRNPRSILAVWHVREDGHYGKKAQD